MIYFLRGDNPDSPTYGLIKIGISKVMSSRLVHLRHEHGAITVLGCMQGYRTQEIALHKRFAPYRAYKNEWFHPALPLLEYIQQNAGERVYTTGVQIDHETNELIKVLQERLGSVTMGDALKEHLLNTLDNDEIQTARELAEIRSGALAYRNRTRTDQKAS